LADGAEITVLPHTDFKARSAELNRHACRGREREREVRKEGGMDGGRNEKDQISRGDKVEKKKK
jgi:hypothetical protein